MPPSDNKRWEHNPPRPTAAERREGSLDLPYGRGEEPLNYLFFGASFAALCAVIVSGFAATYITQERYVYFWDYALYWNFFKTLGSMLCLDWVQAVGSIIRSVREWNYNYLAVLPIAPVECFFGGSRLTYTVAIALLLVLPTAFLAARVVVLLNPDQRPRLQAIVFAVATLFFLLLHPVWIPVFEGRPDIIGLAFAFAILTIYMRRPLHDRSLSVLVGIGILLAVVFLLRRWYAYWIVAFFPAAFIADTLRLPAIDIMKGLRRTTRSLALIGAAFAATVWSVATPLMLRIFATDYSDTYSAYKVSGGAGDAFLLAIKYFGAPLIVVAGLGLGVSMLRRSTRYLAVFLIVQSLILSLLFYRVQDFNAHHYYLLLPIVYLGASALFVPPFGTTARRTMLTAGAIAGLAYLFLCTLTVFSQTWRERVPSRLSTLLPQATRFPKTRADFDRLGALIVELEKQYRARPGKIYVIASSVTLNDDLLRNFCREASASSLDCEDIVTVNHIDKRDGFPRRLLTSRYVVLATPAQYHLRPEDQHVIGILARDFASGTGIARSFARTGPSVVIDNGIEVSIFKREEPIPEDAVKALSREFMALYPEQGQLFAAPQ